LFVSTCNGRPHLALQHHWLLPINCHFDDCKAQLVRFLSKTRYTRISGFSFGFELISVFFSLWTCVVSNKSDDDDDDDDDYYYYYYYYVLPAGMPFMYSYNIRHNIKLDC